MYGLFTVFLVTYRLIGLLFVVINFQAAGVITGSQKLTITKTTCCALHYVHYMNRTSQEMLQAVRLSSQLDSTS